MKFYSVRAVLTAAVGGLFAYSFFSARNRRQPRADEIPLDKLPDETLPFQRALAKEAGDSHFLDVEDYRVITDKLGISTARGQWGFGWINSFFQLKADIDDGVLQPTTENNFIAFLNTRDAFHFVQHLAGDPNTLENADVLALARFFGANAQPLTDKLRRCYETLLSRLERVSNESVKFRGDARFESIVASAKELPQKAFQEFNEKFGLSVALPALPTGIIRIIDSMTLQGEKNGNNNGATTYFNKEGDGITLVVVSAEYLMNGGVSSLKHEQNHLWLASALGYEQYKNSPPWFREGLAVAAAGQIETKQYDTLSFKAPGAVLFDFSTRAIDDPRFYYPDALAVQILIEKYGAEWIGQLIKKMQEGLTFAGALAQLVPEWDGEEAFYKALQAQCLEKMEAVDSAESKRDYADSLGETFLPARATYESASSKQGTLGPTLLQLNSLSRSKNAQQLEEYRKLWESFLKKHSGSSFAPAVHMILGTIYNKLMDNKNAVLHFEAVLQFPVFAFYEEALMLATICKASPDAAGKRSIQETMKRVTKPVVRAWGEAVLRK